MTGAKKKKKNEKSSFPPLHCYVPTYSAKESVPLVSSHVLCHTMVLKTLFTAQTHSDQIPLPRHTISLPAPPFVIESSLSLLVSKIKV